MPTAITSNCSRRRACSGNVHYQVVEMAAGSTLTGRLIHAESATVAAAAPS